MPHADPQRWSEHLRTVLPRYEEALVREVAGRLLRARNQWPTEDLIERWADSLDNPVFVDRRLKDLEAAPRQLLALIGHSRQPRWRVGSLVELSTALGQREGLQPVLALLEMGLLFPDLPDDASLRSFSQWLQQSSAIAQYVFAPPQITTRALGEDLGLPTLPSTTTFRNPQLADGLDWPLRLAAVWQLAAAAPLRQTQQGEFFKRDADRLRLHPLLTSPTAAAAAEPGESALLAVALSQIDGLLTEIEGELAPGSFPEAWQQGLAPALESLWAALPLLPPRSSPQPGAVTSAHSPLASAYLLALLLLARQPGDEWVPPAAVGAWIAGHHPYWMHRQRPGRARQPADSSDDAASVTQSFFQELAFPLQLIEMATSTEGESLVRLSPMGRWVLGIGSSRAAPPPFVKTFLVQPNLEVVVYRQGLSPQLIASLSMLATWKSIGPACTMELEPETIYRALEAGWTFESIVQTLDQFGVRPPPPSVIELLRTWANKRERLSVYPAAAILEFASPRDLEDALARGLPAVRLSDRMLAVPSESAIDYRHFRLTGTRDYGLPPEKCVRVEADGVTLSVDSVRADLLLDSELERFADALAPEQPREERVYRVTPASLARAQETGWTLTTLEEWFVQRTGQGLPAAVRLLFQPAALAPLQLRQEFVLHVAQPEIADGLMQWPETRALIQQRLGPTALSVAADQRPRFVAQLRRLRIAIVETGAEPAEQTTTPAQDGAADRMRKPIGKDSPNI